MAKVAIIGYGKVGQAYHKMFPDAVIYDPYYEPVSKAVVGDVTYTYASTGDIRYDDKEAVNQCDMAIVCVFTALKKNELDVSIVEEVVGWLETPLILIKSALEIGTTDRLIKQTGKKIANSVEMVGEGKYFIPFWRYPHPEDPNYHGFLIIGGAPEVANACAEVMWSRLSPDINIHLTTALEAEITKMMENFWGAQKVTFANMMYDICQEFGANYIKVLQAWGSDGRTEKMHMRVVPGKRGFTSKCWDKDIPALAKFDKSGFAKHVVKANKHFLKQNK